MDDGCYFFYSVLALLLSSLHLWVSPVMYICLISQYFFHSGANLDLFALVLSSSFSI